VFERSPCSTRTYGCRRYGNLSAVGVKSRTLEVRRSLTQNRFARVLFLFCIRQGQMMLLHVFIKKTQQTLENDLNLVVKRQKEVEVGKAAK